MSGLHKMDVTSLQDTKPESGFRSLGNTNPYGSPGGQWSLKKLAPVTPDIVISALGPRQ